LKNTIFPQKETLRTHPISFINLCASEVVDMRRSQRVLSLNQERGKKKKEKRKKKKKDYSAVLYIF
jgi:hypothetical protein